jgi:glycosyltransferase involved in cell wall biosynthesis
LENGRTALMVPPGDIDALTCALVRLLDDAGLRGTLSAAGRQLFTAQFSMPAYDRALVGVYDRFVPGRGGAGFAPATVEGPDRI